MGRFAMRLRAVWSELILSDFVDASRLLFQPVTSAGRLFDCRRPAEGDWRRTRTARQDHAGTAYLLSLEGINRPVSTACTAQHFPQLGGVSCARAIRAVGE